MFFEDSRVVLHCKAGSLQLAGELIYRHLQASSSVQVTLPNRPPPPPPPPPSSSSS